MESLPARQRPLLPSTRRQEPGSRSPRCSRSRWNAPPSCGERPTESSTPRSSRHWSAPATTAPSNASRWRPRWPRRRLQPFPVSASSNSTWTSEWPGCPPAAASIRRCGNGSRGRPRRRRARRPRGAHRARVARWRHARRGRSTEGGWTVPVEHPARPGAAVPHVLTDGALVQSTCAIRSWSRAGARQTHIIDPSSGGAGPQRCVHRCCRRARGVVGGGACEGRDRRRTRRWLHAPPRGRSHGVVARRTRVGLRSRGSTACLPA